MGDVTRVLVGDPPPGRTPWAAPAPPAQARPRPLAEVEASLRAGVKAEAVCAEYAQTASDETMVAQHATTPSSLQDKGLRPEIEPEPTTACEGQRDIPLTPESLAAAENGTQADSLRPVAPLAFDDLSVMPPATAPPLVEWMAPADLLVDSAYQRDLSAKSLALIRRVVEGWDWRRFKPPIVAWTERGFEIIDGQHTAIAAATLGVEKLPVLVVEAAELQDRAGAFIGHNRDRLTVTPGQMHHAAVAAGDADARQVQTVCDRAGVTLLRTAYGSRTYKPGDTLAINAIGALVKRRGERGARETLEVLVKAGQAPVTANGIKAVEMLLTEPDYAGRFEPEDLTKAISTAGDDAEKEAKVFAGANCVPLWKGLAVVWFRKTRKRREA